MLIFVMFLATYSTRQKDLDMWCVIHAWFTRGSRTFHAVHVPPAPTHGFTRGSSRYTHGSTSYTRVMIASRPFHAIARVVGKVVTREEDCCYQPQASWVSINPRM